MFPIAEYTAQHKKANQAISFRWIQKQHLLNLIGFLQIICIVVSSELMEPRTGIIKKISTKSESTYNILAELNIIYLYSEVNLRSVGLTCW